MKDDSKNVFSDKYSSNERWNIAILKKEVEMFNLHTYFLKKKMYAGIECFICFLSFGVFTITHKFIPISKWGKFILNSKIKHIYIT